MSSLGAGSYSMDGLHVSFTRRTVAGVRLSSAPAGSGSFEGWSEVVFHFGRARSGSIELGQRERVGVDRAASWCWRRCVGVMSGVGVGDATESVSVSAGKSLEVRGR